MSQFSTYKSYTLPNQLVQLQTQWAGMKANQIYACGQGKMFEIPVFTTDISSQTAYDAYHRSIVIDFPVPVSYCVVDIYAVVDGTRRHIDPLFYRDYPHTFEVGSLNVTPYYNSNALTKWRFDLWAYKYASTVSTVEAYLTSNVKPSKITVES